MGSRLTVDITSSVNEGANSTALGAHGGSGLSALGGVIRLHEIGPDAPPIAHAIKLELFANQYYYGGGPQKRKLQPPSPSNGGRTQYVWPATGSDSYTWAACGLGSRCLAYHGTNEHLAPGSLLALPEAVASSLIPKLKTVPGARVAAAFRDYGGYIIDDTASDSASLSWESGADDVFRLTYNMTLNTAGGPWYDDLVAIFQGLHVVVNNKPSSIGGGGKPRRPPLPPLCNKGDDDDSRVANLTTVFRAGEDGFGCMRYPQLHSVQDTLYVFVECYNASGDHCDASRMGFPVLANCHAYGNVCYKRSLDPTGTRWGPLQVVPINGSGTMMWARGHGTLYLPELHQICLHFNGGSVYGNNGLDGPPGGARHKQCLDLRTGRWTEPTNLDSQIPECKDFLGARQGNIVLPSGRQLWSQWSFGSVDRGGKHVGNEGRVCVYGSDDGVNWKTFTMLNGTAEGAMVYLPENDSVYFSAMPPCPACRANRARVAGWSTDSGGSFALRRDSSAPLDPVGDAIPGPLLQAHGELIFALPLGNGSRYGGSNTDHGDRLNMAVHASPDGGVRWTRSLQVSGGYGGYGGLSTLPGDDDSFALVFEAGPLPGMICAGACSIRFTSVRYDFGPASKTDDASVGVQIFQHSEGPCTCIGIPIVMRVQDTLLAFGQCRVGVGWAKDDGCYVKDPVPGDSSACNGTCIVLKRSVTGGRTWSNLSVVINGAFNMMPVFDSVRGKLVVSFDTGGAVDDKPFVQQPGATYATTATVGPGILSAAAWSPPTKIFSFPGWASAPGPNVGVQLSGKAGAAGRLVFAGWANNTGRTCVVVIWYSDDGGETFKKGAELPGACEAGLQEMSDGRLLILANDGSARDKGPCPGDTLAHAFSTTGGASFPQWQCDPALINADSQAGLLVVNGTIVVSNPGVNPVTCPPCSLNMRVHASSDGGEHFGLVREFASGGKVWTGAGNNGTAGGYSSLTTLAGTTALGLAWETSGPGSTCVGSRCRVVFSTFGLPE